MRDALDETEKKLELAKTGQELTEARIMAMEADLQQMKALEKENGDLKARIHSLESSLQAARSEALLRSPPSPPRDLREDVRVLRGRVQELEEAKAALESQVVELQALKKDHDNSESTLSSSNLIELDHDLMVRDAVIELLGSQISNSPQSFALSSSRRAPQSSRKVSEEVDDLQRSFDQRLSQVQEQASMIGPPIKHDHPVRMAAPKKPAEAVVDDGHTAVTGRAVRRL